MQDFRLSPAAFVLGGVPCFVPRRAEVGIAVHVTPHVSRSQCQESPCIVPVCFALPQ